MLDTMSNKKAENIVDFLIVGASAAGSLLAAKFAEHGKTVFVDKYLPGSLMNCGGGMPEKIFKAYDVDIPFKTIKRAVMMIHGRECEFPCNYVVVNRSEFDNALYRKACKAGAEFRKMNYTGNDSGRETARFKSEKKAIVEIKYRNLILAKGFHPQKDPFSGIGRVRPAGVARVEIVDCKTPFSDTFYFVISLLGYNWIFPMPDGKVNIGVGGFKELGFSSVLLPDFKTREKISGKIIKKGGGVMPLAPERKIQQRNTYLFGDSAGMINALSGEGLMHISNFSEKFVNAVVKGKNLNRIWSMSSTYWYLLCAAFVFKIIVFYDKIFKIHLYPSACRFVAWIRRCIGDLL